MPYFNLLHAFCKLYKYLNSCLHPPNIYVRMFPQSIILFTTLPLSFYWCRGAIHLASVLLLLCYAVNRITLAYIYLKSGFINASWIHCYTIKVLKWCLTQLWSKYLCRSGCFWDFFHKPHTLVLPSCVYMSLKDRYGMEAHVHFSWFSHLLTHVLFKKLLVGDFHAVCGINSVISSQKI